MSNKVAYSATLQVRDTCVCLHAQRAARALARRFDEIFKPLDLTSGQFSLIMSLNRPEPPSLGSVATLLGMDRTTLTAALKPLERRGLVEIDVDDTDRRRRRLRLTDHGADVLERALPLWQRGHAAVDRRVEESARLRRDLRALESLVSDADAE